VAPRVGDETKAAASAEVRIADRVAYDEAWATRRIPDSPRAEPGEGGHTMATSSAISVDWSYSYYRSGPPPAQTGAYPSVAVIAVSWISKT
jgi:hypothetical protein